MIDADGRGAERPPRVVNAKRDVEQVTGARPRKGREHMEQYYLISDTMTATAFNEANAGRVTTRYYGKGQEVLFAEGTYNGFCDCNRLDAYNVRKYGYKRETDAKRSYIYKNAHDDRSWKENVSVFRVWVRKDNRVVLFP